MISSLLLAASVVAYASAYTDLGNGAVEGVLVNPGAPPKVDLLGKTGKGDMKGVGENDRNALGPEARWTDGIIPYEFDSSVNPSMKQFINAAIQDFADYTCIKFKPRTSEPNWIKFIDDQDGCYSYVGNIKRGGQPLALQYPGCDSKGTAIHEIMHAIGFGHEQCRPDRDQFIEVITGNVQPSMMNNFDKYDGVGGRAKGNVFGFAYDFNSIMHYSNDSFSMTRGGLTMRRRDGKPLVVQHLGFSDYDVKKVNLYYECAKKPGFKPKPFVQATVPPPATIDQSKLTTLGIQGPPPSWGCTQYVYDASCTGIKAFCAGKQKGYSWSWKMQQSATGAKVCTVTCVCA
jgi:hypothetical protein